MSTALANATMIADGRRTLATAQTYLQMLALLMPIAAAMLALVKAFRLVSVPYELGYGEGLVIWLASQAFTLERMYDSIDHYPFVVAMYPPVHSLLTALITAAVGSEQLAGRLLGLFSLVGTAGVAAILGYSIAPDEVPPRTRTMAAAVAAALATTPSSVTDFAPAVRVDGLAELLSLSGVAAFVVSAHRQWLRYAAFALFAAAVLTKQSFVAAPFACFAIAAWRAPRSTVGPLLVFAILTIVPLAGLHVATDGESTRHLFLYTQNPYSVAQLMTLLGANVLEMLPLIALAIGTAYSASLQGSTLAGTKQRAAIQCLTGYGLCAGAVALSAGKVGAAPYYFMEWNVACAVLAAIGLIYVRPRDIGLEGAFRTIPPLLVLLFSCTQVVHVANSALSLTSGARALRASRLSETTQAVDLIRGMQGPVLAYDMTLLMRAGKELPFEPFIMYELAKSGMWDPAPFVDQLKGRHYAAIVAESVLADDSRIPPTIRTAMIDNYEFSASIGRYRIYQPRTK